MAIKKREGGGVHGTVTHTGRTGSVGNVEVTLTKTEVGQTVRAEELVPGTTFHSATADQYGRFTFTGYIEEGFYTLRCSAFGVPASEQTVHVRSGGTHELHVDIPLEFRLSAHQYADGERLVPTARGIAGRRMMVRADSKVMNNMTLSWHFSPGVGTTQISPQEYEVMPSNAIPVEATVTASYVPQGAAFDQPAGANAPAGQGGGGDIATASLTVPISQPEINTIGGHVGVTLHRTASDPTLDQALWVAIRNRTHAISFNRYREFIDRVLRWEESDRLPEAIESRLRDLGTHLHGVGAYQILKMATETFLLLECGVRIERHPQDRFPLDPFDEQSRLGEPVSMEQMQTRLREYLGHPAQLPYITRVVEAAFPDYERSSGLGDRVLTARINQPCLLELIWSYWHEEGMLMQSINAVGRRFQNVRVSPNRDALANLEIDPLRPLNNLIWGYIQDEPNRISVTRRAYEYMHQYGLTLFGRAVHSRRPADNRSKFLEAFHNLLYQSSVFFKEDFQTTVIADGFPLLNSLQEVHLVLAQGAHNQFGDLPWTARTEMLLAEYMLARPEIRDFLQSRAMVPYKEPWMPQVDAMKALQGWSDVTVTHFRDLGVYGEQLLLSIRYGDWIHVNNEDSAKNWARYWRPEIQGYLHAYRVATGIDLTNPDTIDATLPSVLLQRRLGAQQSRMRL
jgi:hypothetical protein